MQAVAEFVEQGQHVVMGEQGRLAFGRRREIAGQEGHRQLQLLAVVETGAADIHPGTAALAIARVQVDVGAGEHAAVGVAHVVIAHVRMPHVDVFARGQA